MVAGGQVLQKCHMSNGKSKIYIKNKKIEEGDERHSSNTLNLSRTVGLTVSTVLLLNPYLENLSILQRGLGV